jgi:hypothetical protein
MEAKQEQQEQILDIALTPVQSSQIHAIGYDAGSSTMRVQFKGAGGPGSVYDYTGVPGDVHAEFVKSESIGRFFGAKVKGAFEYRKLPAAKKEAA